MISRLKKLAKKLLGLSGNEILDISGIKLLVDLADVGGAQYQGRPAVEEVQNQLYSQLAKSLNPSVVVDIGANYGFTGAIFSRYFTGAELILVEPDPKLGRYIEQTMKINEISDYSLIPSICGDQECERVCFGVNPSSSQDNRVQPLPGWKTVDVSSTTLSKILLKFQECQVFIKVDTQGFETQVFKGGEDYLSSNVNWFIKTEFAPNWLESQGNDPKELLRYMSSLYRVVEAPSRTRFRRDSLNSLFTAPLIAEEIDGFLDYVRSLNRNGLGWVDLYVAPKSANKALEPTALRAVAQL